MKLNKSYRNRAIDRGVISWLRSGGVGVLPTDTIYGIVGSALNPKTVRRIYGLRKRNPKKPMIILIGSINELNIFGVKLQSKIKNFLIKIWPAKISVILPCKSKKFVYLHRDTKTLAFRLPKQKWLRNLLTKTGPLVAPSANWEGKPPANNIKEAQKYFGTKVDFYVDRGEVKSKPSKLIKIDDGRIEILRK